MTAVVAGTRLHFGLFAAGGTFGGCGLMLQQPAVRVTVEPGGDGWSASGPLADRALGFARRFPGGGRVHADGPPEHVGLGVGTALGLAVARAVAPHLGPDERAAAVGRGKRSGVGLHGFRLGGFVADAGKPAADALPRLAGRCDFPSAWRVVLVRPRVAGRWSGGREQEAFDRPRPAGDPSQLSELAASVLLPAATAADFATFAPALGDYNRLAGEPFAADQGGPYAGPDVIAVVDAFRAWGWAGVGQSSWGPTVFAVCPDEPAARGLAERCRHEFANLDDVTVTAARNEGATVSSGGHGPPSGGGGHRPPYPPAT